MRCFYHSADFDGHCSGAIVKHFMPECELIGFDYGHEFPWSVIEPGETVFMVDVSLPIAQMVQLSGLCHLVWIDHHVGIIREFNELSEEERHGFDGRLDISKAACELCWEFLSDAPVPDYVEQLGVYDSWRFTPEEEFRVKILQCGLKMYRDTRPETNMPLWESLFSGVVKDVSRNGRVIFAYQEIQHEKSCRSGAFDTVLVADPEGVPLRCIAVNSNMMTADLFKSVWDPAKHDAMVCFYWSNRGFWRVSIYSTKPDVDCSVWAKRFGGGGHKGAAGFRYNVLPFGFGEGKALGVGLEALGNK